VEQVGDDDWQNVDGAERQYQRQAYNSQSGTEEPSHADSYAIGWVNCSLLQ